MMMVADLHESHDYNQSKQGLKKSLSKKGTVETTSCTCNFSVSVPVR